MSAQAGVYVIGPIGESVPMKCATASADPWSDNREPWQVGMEYALDDVRGERASQRAKWGDDSAKDHEDGTGSYAQAAAAERAKRITDSHAHAGRLTWADILREEFHEALAESDPVLLRAELVQVAAVAVKWVEAIDRRADQ